MPDPAPWAAPIAGNLPLTSPWRLFLDGLLRRLDAASAPPEPPEPAAEVSIAQATAFGLAPGAGRTLVVAAEGFAAGAPVAATYRPMPTGVALAVSIITDGAASVSFVNAGSGVAMVTPGTLRIVAVEAS